MDRFIEFKYLDPEEGTEITISLKDGLHFPDFLEKVKLFALAIGYHPSTISDFISEEGGLNNYDD